MIEMKQLREPATGFMASIGVKGFTDMADTADKLIAVSSPTPEHTIMVYFLIGVAGAVGGLLVRIVWGICKRRFPALQNIDK